MRKFKSETKKNILRVLMLIMAVAMILGFVMLPLAQDIYAEEDNSAVTVTGFDTGSLSAAIDKAKDGTDLNLIKKISVSGGTLNAADYSAICGYPNAEIIELAGCETENGEIPDNAMPSRNKLMYISLPKNTVTIGSGAFSGNRELIKISFPSTVRHIGDRAFEGCEKIESFVIPAETETIGASAFSDCKALSSFSLPESITEIPDYCFMRCSFKEIHIGPQVTHIGSGAFSDCHDLTDIYFYGDTPFTADESAFQNLKVTVHTYEDAEGFDVLTSNFVSVSNDMSENSTYIPPKPAEIDPAYEDRSDTDSAEPEKEEDTASAGTDVSVPAEETSDLTETLPEVSDAPAESIPAQSSASSGFGGAAVAIIAVLCAALGVTVTLLIVGRKKK